MPRNPEQAETGHKSEIECARTNHVTFHHLSGVLLNGNWQEPRSVGSGERVKRRALHAPTSSVHPDSSHTSTHPSRHF